MESILEVDMQPATASSRSSRQHFRLTVLPLAALVTLAAAALAGALLAPRDSGQLGGDFPSFYAAGSIVSESGYADLYDPAVQRAAQDGLLEDEGGFLFFAYPPFVATAYSWLVPAGYRIAYVIQMALMAAAAVGAVLLLRPISSFVARYQALIVAAVVLFQPLLASLIGGQNTALTMLLIAAAVRAEYSGYPVIAGVAVGLLIYKPQYGLPLALLVAIAGRWRVLSGVVASWGALYLAGAAALGLGWIGPWWEQATAFRDLNATANGRLFVSWPGYLEHLTGVGGTTGRALALIIGALGFIGLAWLWRRDSTTTVVGYGLAAAGLMAIAPQALFYEAGVAAITLILIADALPRGQWAAAAAWVTGWVYAATAGLLNTTVLVLALTAVVAAAAWVALTPRAAAGVRAAT